MMMQDDDDEAINEWFEERLAIMIVCGGRSERGAVKVAAIRTRKRYGRITDAIKKQVDAVDTVKEE